MALDLLGYPPRSSGSRGSAKAVRRADGGRRQPLLLPALLLGGVGHRHRGLRAGRIAPSLPRDALRKCADWLLTKEVRRKGDWSVKRPNTRALRLVFRIRQRVLSRYRRHRHGAAGAEPLARVQPAEQQALRAPRHPVAARHAVQGRRLGGVRCGQQLAPAQLRSVRRPQRHARSHLSGHHRPRARSAVRLRLRRSRIRPSASGVDYLVRTQEADGSWYGRWGVDYVYGTFLALRGLQAAGVSDREAYVQRGARMGALHPEFRRRLGRKLRQLQAEELTCRAQHAFANRLGGSGAARRRRYHQHQPARRHRLSDPHAE